MPLSAPAREEVAALVERVRFRAPGTRPGPPTGERAVRWVRMDGLHLTLRFIGPTDEARLDPLRDATRRAADGQAAFVVRLGEAGAFPNARRPRTLWLGAGQGAAALAALNRRVDEEVERAGWPPDPRPFRAHLTLARSDGVAGAAATAAILAEQARGLDVAWTVDRLVLFESITGGGPARYEPLFETVLGHPADGVALQAPSPRG